MVDRLGWFPPPPTDPPHHPTSLVGQLGAGLLLFESVYERLDATLDAGGDATGHGAGRWRRSAAGPLRGGVCQTLLIAHLRRERERRETTGERRSGGGREEEEEEGEQSLRGWLWGWE